MSYYYGPRYAPRFTVYHKASTMESKSFYWEHHAKAHAKKKGAEYAYTTVEDYKKNVVYMVERINLMSGKKYMEPSNTPIYLSPSSETYWSM